MEKVLEAGSRTGYPTEYLVARLKGRSMGFIKNWDSLLVGGSGGAGPVPGKAKAYSIAAREFLFVYLQMNSALRETFRPFFLFFELGTLFCCLRLKTRAGMEERIQAVLETSALCPAIKEALLRGASVEAVLSGVERACPAFSSSGGPPFRKQMTLEELYLKSGLREVERSISEHWFECIPPCNPPVRSFFTWLIDARNIMTAYKFARWGIKGEPGFIPGGGIEMTELGEALTKDLPGVFSLAQKYMGEKTSSGGQNTPGELTTYLLRGLAKRSRMWKRLFPDEGFILDYLIRCRLQARNFSMIAEGEDLERELVREELFF